MIKYSTGCEGLQKYLFGPNLYKGICATKCVCQICWISEAIQQVKMGQHYLNRFRFCKPFIRALCIIEEQQLQQCYCWYSCRDTPWHMNYRQELFSTSHQICMCTLAKFCPSYT